MDRLPVAGCESGAARRGDARCAVGGGRRLAVGLLRRAVGCRGTDLRPVDALSGRGARTVDRTGYLRSVRHALPRAAGGAESLPRRGAGAVAGRLHHAGGHRRDRLCRFAAFASAQRRGAPCGGEGFRTDQGVAGGAAGRCDERLFQSGPRKRRGHSGGGRRSRREGAFRAESGDSARDARRFRDQCRLLHLLQREKPHGPRLLLGTGGRVGQQRALLRAGRRAVVLAVLRAGHGQELLRRGAADAGLLVEHPHVAQRAVQQSVGHPAARVARRRPPYGGGARDGSADPDLFDRISATGKIEKTMKLIDNESLDRQIGVVAEVAGYLWERGWAERNGGNISVNVTGLCADAVCELPALDGPYPLPKPVPHIAGGCFLVTGTGRRMRYVASQPLANVALIRVAADGASYEIVADEPVRPTSELPAHLSVHDYLIGAGRLERAVVHTHPIELVAMTHNPEFLGKDVLTRLLWSMIPETRAFCPKGLGIVPYTLPGSQELADRTIALLDDYDVVMWTKHGALAIGTDLIEAFDQIDVLSKSAKIYESARSMGFVPTGMSDAEMQELKEVFGL